jgi:hypothetical protein
MPRKRKGQSGGDHDRDQGHDLSWFDFQRPHRILRGEILVVLKDVSQEVV